MLALGVTCIIYASPFSNSRDVPDMFSKVECTWSSPPAPPAPLSSCRGLTGRCSASLRSAKRSDQEPMLYDLPGKQEVGGVSSERDVDLSCG